MSDIKQRVQQNIVAKIKNNRRGEITGQILQDVLIDMSEYVVYEDENSIYIQYGVATFDEIEEAFETAKSVFVVYEYADGNKVEYMCVPLVSLTDTEIRFSAIVDGTNYEYIETSHGNELCEIQIRCKSDNTWQFDIKGYYEVAILIEIDSLFSENPPSGSGSDSGLW